MPAPPRVLEVTPAPQTALRFRAEQCSFGQRPAARLIVEIGPQQLLALRLTAEDLPGLYRAVREAMGICPLEGNYGHHGGERTAGLPTLRQ